MLSNSMHRIILSCFTFMRTYELRVHRVNPKIINSQNMISKHFHLKFCILNTTLEDVSKKQH